VKAGKGTVFGKPDSESKSEGIEHQAAIETAAKALHHETIFKL
jgi:hypothetical protein